MVEQHLHTHAHTHQRLVGSGVHDRVEHAAGVQIVHAIAHTTLSGQHHPVGIQNLLRGASPNDFHASIGCHMHHRLRDRAQIAHAVVHYCYGFHSFLRIFHGG